MAQRFLGTALILLLVPGAARSADERASIQGVWDISALIEGGEAIPLRTVREKMVKDARLTFSGQTINFVRPSTGEKRELVYMLEPTVRPRAIDLAGGKEIGSKGIYLLADDVLLLCINGPDMLERPTEFTSRDGSHTVFLVLRRAQSIQAVTVAKPIPPTTPVVLKTPEEETRRMLLGTWGHQDSDRIDLATFNEDGSFTSTRTWKKGFKRIFEEDIRTSGTWKLENGVIIVHVTVSTHKEMNGQVYSYRITSLTPNDLIYVDQDGQVRREWKTRY